MPITTLDSQSALIVIDLQRGILALDTCHPVAPVVDNIAKLISAFRRAHLPVVLVNVAGTPSGRNDQKAVTTKRPTDWSQLADELDVKASDHLVTKNSWGAFTQTDLQQYLKLNGISQVVIVGIATSLGVESTARQAWELGYNVCLPTDAMTDLNIAAHHHCLQWIFPKIAETGSTQALLSLLI